MKRSILAPILVGACCVAWWAAPGPARSAQGLLLAEKHKSAGVECAACHTEQPPKIQAPMAVCFGCHGEHDTMAAKTGTLDPNPHKTHLGKIDCDKCHHLHKPSENHCKTCHDIDLVVP